MAEAPTLSEQIRNLSEIWQNMALHAADFAHARMTMYRAYLAEGFTEAQALEWIKSL